MNPLRRSVQKLVTKIFVGMQHRTLRSKNPRSDGSVDGKRRADHVGFGEIEEARMDGQRI